MKKALTSLGIEGLSLSKEEALKRAVARVKEKKDPYVYPCSQVLISKYDI